MIRHTLLFLGHELRNTFRNPIWPLFGIVQPVVYLLLFGPLVAGSSGRSMAAALTSFAPGMLVITALFGAIGVGYGMIYELRSGVLERIAVSPAWRPSIVLGRTLRDGVVLVAQSVAVLLIALAMGMRASLPGLVLTVLLVAVTGLFASGIGYGLALSLRDENGMAQTMQFFALPIMLLSGALLPMTLAPEWMQKVALFNPMYHPVVAGRALFAGHLADPSVPLAFGIMLVLSALTVTWSVRSLRAIAG
ncbi:ABC transporter permease [Nonomuraea sp. SMC257]|uniref:Transport permease protein n=1 Tax=Nonomuraea montanisoli TaxID=2741721 RepID=A0A7Y6M922_9ACTN|nr:ABC transporter permease [Nonomuraea montanisoli]NUW38146.1 ABC transporter permease [Nonomuraea montanisoli]